ncbi:MAG: HAMP domain-containing protein [Deltaproteobacteria bacterium]|nr:HAMP domain-containing protein [Deltaproteobacteria bacterium]
MRSLLHKLLLSSLLIIFLPMGLAILWTSKTLSSLLEVLFVEKSSAHTEQVKLLLGEKRETATGLVHWIAEMPGVKKALEQDDRDGLFQQLLPVVGSIEVDFIEILEPEGNIFLRVHDPSRYGDRPNLASDVQDLLHGVRDFAAYGVEARDGKAYLRASETVEGEGVVGVVSVGYALNRDFIHKLERLSGSRIVITIGDRQYNATQVEPAVEHKTLAPSEGIQSGAAQWHRDGPAPSLEIRLPLETDRGTEGVLALFFPTLELRTAITALRVTLFFVALLGIALAFMISWILSRRFTRPLKELARGTEQVAAGNYATEVRPKSQDEIGTLAASFNRMLEELRRSKAEAEGYRLELERKFVERGKELAETEKKRAAMAHMVAHDLKNPLLGIKKTLERLEQTRAETTVEQRRRLVQELLSASDLVIGMVNEMLDLYRSDFGELPLSLSPFPIDEPIQTCLRILAPELDEKGIKVVSRLGPPNISLVADKRRLTRLLINLLSNAIKFSSENGQITVSASLREDGVKIAPQVLLRVEDEGAGLTEQDLSKIFDLFYSRDQGRIDTGTGLGLPYCKLVAEAHGGKIWAESRGAGGFAVSVLLPLNTGGASRAYAT